MTTTRTRPLRARGHTTRAPKRVTWVERRAARITARNRLARERAERAARRAARWQIVTGLIAMGGRGVGATVGFVAPRVAATCRRCAPGVYRAAQRAGWAPREPLRQRSRQVRADIGAYGLGAVVVDDWTSPHRLPHHDVDEYLGQHAERVGDDVAWRDVPQSREPHPEPHPDTTDGGVRVSPWRGRRLARRWSENVDQALEAWRAGRPDVHAPDLDPAPAPRALVPGICLPPRDGDAIPMPPAPTPSSEPVSGPSRRRSRRPLDPSLRGGAVLVLPARRPLTPTAGKGADMAAPAGSSITLQGMEELLDPDWSQKTFDEDVPDWLDQLHNVEHRLAELTEELSELADRVELPEQTRSLLRNIADAQAELPPMAQQAAAQCRELYESYEIPDLDKS